MRFLCILLSCLGGDLALSGTGTGSAPCAPGQTTERRTRCSASRSWQGALPEQGEVDLGPLFLVSAERALLPVRAGLEPGQNRMFLRLKKRSSWLCGP